MNNEVEHIIRLIAKFFEPPCQYEYGDIDAFEFINSIDPETGIEWCEEHCGEATGFDCWVRFLSMVAKCEDEQLEYGGE